MSIAGHVDIGKLRSVSASVEELGEHEQWLERLRKSEDGCAWDRMN